MEVCKDLSDLMYRLAHVKHEKLSLIRPKLESLLIAHKKGEADLSSSEYEMLIRAVECTTLTDLGINKSLFNMPASEGANLAAMSADERALYTAKISNDFDAAANQLIELVSLMHQLISFNNNTDSLAEYA